MRTIARTAILVLVCAALAGCSAGKAGTGKAEAANAAKKPASAPKTVKLPEVPVPAVTKPPKIVPPAESACRVALSGFVKDEMAGKLALATSNGEWHVNLTTGSLAGKGYNARAFIAFKGKPAQGSYTEKDVATAQFTVVDKAKPERMWTFTGTQTGGAFKMTLTSASEKAIHGTIEAALPPVARTAPESSVIHMKVTF